MATRNFCFFGHVDSGKSTLCGHLWLKCNKINRHELLKLEDKGSQKYSCILDEYQEEQIRGKTQDYNVISLQYQNTTFNIIDTPGHKNYIARMIQGLSNFDTDNVIGCLLISLRTGEFESGWTGGQTKEDIVLARSLGINNLIVVYNKMDAINWDQEIYKKAMSKVDTFVRSCGFPGVYHVPISAYNGTGLLNTENYPEWYTGRSFIETVLSIEPVVDNTVPILEKEWQQTMVDLKIVCPTSVIVEGFSSALHYDGEIYLGKIIKIDKKKILRFKDRALVIIEADRLIERSRNTRRIILRDGNNTIAYGTITRVK